MTSDDDRPTDRKAAENAQGGLPPDAGNQMWDRSEWTGESESGMTNTPDVTDSPRRPTDRVDRGIPKPPGETNDGTSTGTTFGTTAMDDKGM
ncbi:hypothetical protein E5F05_06695 [Deinococcus metallilatus]|uniref:Uncharacterized protein n=2 Tax=Deinococcus TaxID=1298 RepID=A0AAJ5K0U5_9DEIO|nr:hypothetical protein [Deinococcus metallilatus]MBB5294635.1 hypothetical protein [Deinococcus metallilatus]QBY07672.1 hypothetical protein E5F05_06695 [Deinococcus metallilatus]RXJ14088.1 hypothetical protein ERJ73_05530 [Deinococcus metallilatus]TLK30053.1 hypothetical protein FCS05_05845 [Deinococcus metallilatus]GMA15848.1 hypothetical protein GCM10025871_21790 [Deinococcus metallilatus]